VDDDLDVTIDRVPEGRRLEDVAPSGRPAAGSDEVSPLVVPHESVDLVPTVGEPFDESMPQHAGCTRDEHRHRELGYCVPARGPAPGALW
jgi:hypothetical protein